MPAHFNPHEMKTQVLLLHAATKVLLHGSDEPGAASAIEDGAKDAAHRLIEMAGFDSQDSDHFGDEMGGAVQYLLEIVMMRCPQLADRITGYADDVKIDVTDL